MAPRSPGTGGHSHSHHDRKEKRRGDEGSAGPSENLELRLGRESLLSNAPGTPVSKSATAPVVLVGALAVDVAIGLAHGVNAGGLPILDRSVGLLDVRGEHNLSTWWSSAKLFTIAVVLALLIPRLLADRRALLVIGFAAVMFAFLSLDEFAQIHEFLGRRTRFDAMPVTGLWPFVFGALGLACAVFLIAAGRPIWARDRIAGICLAGGLIAYIASAAGLDLIVNVGPGESTIVHIVSFIEEMGEAIAASVILYGAWRLSDPVPTGSAIADT